MQEKKKTGNRLTEYVILLIILLCAVLVIADITINVLNEVEAKVDQASIISRPSTISESIDREMAPLSVASVVSDKFW